jgi:serine/threonine protein kinase
MVSQEPIIDISRAIAQDTDDKRVHEKEDPHIVKSLDDGEPPNELWAVKGNRDLMYRVHMKIGSGSFGVVFKATKISDNALMAIKFVDGSSLET